MLQSLDWQPVAHNLTPSKAPLEKEASHLCQAYPVRGEAVQPRGLVDKTIAEPVGPGPWD